MGVTRIVQMLPAFQAADAVGNVNSMITRVAQAAGLESIILAEHSAVSSPMVRGMGMLDQPLGDGTLLLYHHSTGSDMAARFGRAKAGAKIVFYHNITPPALLSDVPELAARCAEGLMQLHALAAIGCVCVTPSEFNRQELLRYRFRDVRVLPLAVSDELRGRLAKGDVADASKKPDQTGEMGTHFLHVGRILPHKAIEDVIGVFGHYQRNFDAAAQLKLIGARGSAPDYDKRLDAFVAENAIRNVEFAGEVSEEQLAQAYRESDVYLCMSLHEGFCVPLAEAMAAGVPIVARAAGAIAETAGGAGLVFRDEDLMVYAEAARQVVTDGGARKRLREAGRERAERFTESAFAKDLKLTMGW